MVYNSLNLRTAVVDANDHRTSFSYDANYQLLEQKDPLLRRTTFSYDAAQRLVKRVDARGLRTTYVLDAIDRLTGRRYSDGTRVTMAYDVLDNRTNLRDSSGRSTYTYDALSRTKTAIDRTGNRLTYTYDAVSQPRSLRSAAGLFTYTFDAAGRSAGFRDPRTTWTYDTIGQRLAQYNSNGTRVSYSYDAAGQVTRTTNLLSGGSVASDYATKYDKAGNRTQVTNNVSGLVTTYAYDKAYQLVADHTAVDRNTYSYDPVGNRQVFRRADGTRATYTYDAANQMTRILDAGVPSTLTYDQAGNPLKQRNTVQPFNITMTWDAESRMVGYHQSGVSGGNSFNQQLTHVYNGDGLRVERTGGPGQAKYVWDGQNIHLKLSGANAILDSYRLEPATYGKLISTSSRWHLYDPLGSSTLLTSSVGGIQGTYRFGAWGEIASASTSGTVVDPFLFVGRAGYYSDDEGIDKNTTSPILPYYVRARYYNSAWGRWLNQDPIGFAGGDNLFRYVANNPLNSTDPSGLGTCTLVQPVEMFYGNAQRPTASGGGFGVGVSTNPGIAGRQPVRVLHCTRTRIVNVKYECTDIQRYGFCYLRTRTRTYNTFLTFEQEDNYQVTIGPNTIFIFTTGLEAPIPRTAVGVVTWYWISPGDQARADRECLNQAPPWPQYTPDPTANVS